MEIKYLDRAVGVARVTSLAMRLRRRGYDVATPGATASREQQDFLLTISKLTVSLQETHDAICEIELEKIRKSTSFAQNAILPLEVITEIRNGLAAIIREIPEDTGAPVPTFDALPWTTWTESLEHLGKVLRDAEMNSSRRYSQVPDFADLNDRIRNKVSQEDVMKWPPIFRAAFEGDIESVRNLLQERPDLAIRDAHGFTAIKWALTSHKPEVAVMLLAHYLRTAREIHVASANQLAAFTYHQVFQYSRSNNVFNDLVDMLANPSQQRLQFISALLQEDDSILYLDQLWEAGSFDRPLKNTNRVADKRKLMQKELGYLHLARGEVVKRDDEDIWLGRLLHVAIRDNNLAAMKMILLMGADPNMQYRRRSPLHAATFRKNPAFAEVLLRHGADPLANAFFGLTPLQLAAIHGFEDTCAALAQSGQGLSYMLPENPPPYPEFVSNLSPLMLVCGLDNSEDPNLQKRIASVLLAHGADVNSTDRDGLSVLYHATASRNSSLVALLIGSGAKCTIVDSNGLTVLHHLVLRPRSLMSNLHSRYRRHAKTSYELETEACFNLILQHCPVDFIHRPAPHRTALRTLRNPHNLRILNPVSSPIAMAIAEQDWLIFELLSDFGAEFCTDIDLTLLLAVAHSAVHPSAVRLLVKHGARLSDDHSSPESGTLFGVVTIDSELDHRLLEEVIGALSTINSDLEHVPRDNFETVLLSVARSTDDADLCRALLEAGADPKKTNQEGIDAFVQACLKGQSKLLRCLLSFPHGKRNQHPSRTPFEYEHVVDGLNDTAIVCQAIKNSKSIDANFGSISLLSHALYHGNDHMAQVLLDLGADLSHKPQRGWTALNIAVKHNGVAIIHRLLDAGVDVDARNAGDSQGWGPVHVCARFGKLDNLRVLLARGADPHLIDSRGWQAIHYATVEGHGEILEYLIEQGACIDAFTHEWPELLTDDRRPSGLWVGSEWIGRPLHLAAMCDDVVNLKTLLDAGADVNALAGPTRSWGGWGDSVLEMVLFTGIFHGRRAGNLDKSRLDMAQMLVDFGTDIAGVVDQLQFEHVLQFRNHQQLWDVLRGGITGRRPKVARSPTQDEI